MRKPDEASERRLDEIRRQHAEAPATSNQQQPTYYDLPLLKPPVWTWEVPAYFFVGGAAGAAAVLGFAAQLNAGSAKLIRDARWIAAIGGGLSTPLLIADLGRPKRFLYMLRVFKVQSPMSVGAWIVTAFSGASTAAVLLRGRARDVSAGASALLGLGMATYTGVLIGVTAIPVWRKHAATLPVLFGASALASAASLLELRGNREPALHYLALTAAAFETLNASAIEFRADRHSEPLRAGATGLTNRVASLLSGPIPLALRLFGRNSRRLRRASAASALLGSLLTRVAWIEAGRKSSTEPRGL